MRSIKLNTGVSIPIVGLGTWQLEDKEELLKALETAYKIGYRHIDTAACYGNEEFIGEFIKTKNRKELFITTKLWNTDHDIVEEAYEKSIKNLKVESVDLYLVHWPVNMNGEFNLEKLWKQMEQLVEKGKVKTIGVSNFGLKNLNKLLSFCKIKPAVNQLELHPYLPQTEIVEFCKKNDIQVISYSSLGSSGVDGVTLKKDPVILEIANKYKVGVSQVILSYLTDKDICVVPRSKSEEHQKENFELIKLKDEDKKAIDQIKTRKRYVECEFFGPNRFD